ncbi:hypothetical protein FRB99_001648, partial [Tulasnella sp. 403]
MRPESPVDEKDLEAVLTLPDASPSLPKLDEKEPQAKLTDQDDCSPEISQPPNAPDESGVLTGFKLVSVIGSIMFSVYLVALDRSVIATAIPGKHIQIVPPEVITSEFHDLNDAPWLATVYFLTQAGCLLLWGQILSILPTKWVYIAVVVVFEAGSVLCGAAWNMSALIAGRAIAGLASSGMM